MSQVTTYTIANQTAALVRAQINAVIAAIVTNAAGATEPTETHPHQLWIDTSVAEAFRILRIRNAANTGWIKLPFSVGVDNSLGADPISTPAITAPQITFDSAFRIDNEAGELFICPVPYMETRGVKMSAVDGILRALYGGIGFPDGSVAPSAGIIQVKTAVKTARQQIVPNGDWYAISGLSVTITPQSANSTFVVLACVPCGVSTSNIIAMAVRRDATVLAQPASPGSRTPCDWSMATSTPAYDVVSPQILHLDAPATASSITYDVAVFGPAGPGGISIAGCWSDSNNVISPRTQARLIVAEIGGDLS